MNQEQFQPQFEQQPAYPQMPEPNNKPSALKHYGLMAVAAVLFVTAGVVTFMALNGSDANKAAVTKTEDTSNQVEQVDSPAVASSKSALIELGANGPSLDSLTVTPGTSVVWKNTDTKTHTLAGDSIGDNNTVDKGASFSYVFDQPGDYVVKDGSTEITVMVKE